MKQKYIATFFSHFGAIRFEKEIRKYGIRGIVKPVPRSLSSSCGTCVEFELNATGEKKLSEDINAVLVFKDNRLHINDRHNEIEQVAVITEDGYREIYIAK